MQNSHTTKPFVDQIQVTIGLGRALAKIVRQLFLGRNAVQFGLYPQCLHRLEAGEVFDPRDDEAFALLATGLRGLIEPEIVARGRTFVGVQDPEGGDHGEVQEALLLTDQGNRYADALDLLEQFCGARRWVLDTVAAEAAAADLSNRAGV